MELERENFKCRQEETAFNWLRRVVIILTAFYSIFTYITIIARMRGGIDLFGYLFIIDLVSFSITQISVGTLIDMHTK